MQDENAQLKDWVERLCDYCNLSDNDRQLLLEEIKQKKQKAERKEEFSQYIQNNELFKLFLNYLQ